MLSELVIENFAIIDRLHVRFFPGFSVLTGETGAGKSIIIDALQTALGARVGADVIRDGASLASVEAIFDPEDPTIRRKLSELLNEYGIDESDEIILRREVSAAGRSSARINGRAVPASVLSAAGSLLVDIHGQSEHLSILRRERQLEVLDRYAGLTQQRAQVAACIDRFMQLDRSLHELTGSQRQAEQRLDLLRFQLAELESAQLQEDEERVLEEEKNLLSNAERLNVLAGSIYEALEGESDAALPPVLRAASSSNELAAIDPSQLSIRERLESARYELEDIAQEMRAYRDGVEFDPDRLATIEERLDLLAKLKRKYAPTLEELISYTVQIRAELEGFETIDDRIEKLRNDVATAEQDAGAAAASLSEARKSGASTLSVAMAEALQGLGLGSTRFEVQLGRERDQHGLPLPGESDRFSYSRTGIDSIQFLVSFNIGEPMRPIERVASGGETSRFLLALKSVLADADQIPTLIFDEVDVGVGGRAAVNVGERVRELARAHQVLSITHLPQLAALADYHISVSKSVSSGRTTVAVDTLDRSDRVVEIAHMLAGTDSAAARHNAEELLEAARRHR